MSRPVGRGSSTLESRYWSHVDKLGPDECWPWTASRKKAGHGNFWTGYDETGRIVMGLAHRVAWQLAHGEHPGELHVRHRCDNPPCQNPAHLELGTHLDNMKDMVDRRRFKTMYGSQHGKSKLTEVDVLDIRARYTAGQTQKAIADAYGVTQANVSCIVKRQTWKHVEEVS